MRLGKREAGTSLATPEDRDPAWITRVRFLTLSAITLAAFLFVGCGGEEEKSKEQAEEVAIVEEVESTESQEATGSVESREVPEPAETREEVELAGSQEEIEPIENLEEKVVPEPKMASTEEVATPAETVPPAPPPQPEPPATGISAVQTAVPDIAIVGQPLTFTITVKNNAATQRAALKDFLPTGMSLVSATPSQGSCGSSHHGGNTVECTLGAVPSGGSATVGIVVTPTVPGTMTNTAVTLAEFTPATPASSASSTITVSQAPGANIGEAHKAH